MQTAVYIHNKRKRHFFIFCTWLMILTIGLLTLIDLREGDMDEFIADIVVLSVLLGGQISIRLAQWDMLVFRTIFILIFLNFYYAVTIGAGETTVLFWTFFMPPLFFYFFGKREGMIWGVFFFLSVAFLILLLPYFNGYVYGSVIVSRFLIAFPVVTILCYGLESSRDYFSQQLDDRNHQLAQEKANLEQALKEIKTLTGLIPICAKCKKIRNDEGYWERVEGYIEARTTANFSHGLCPGCIKQLYPDLKIKKKSNPQ